jgi:N-acetylglucosaminyldiphosphoundecaprenol N-acetyl-beta-D-mannosaminyltransferase
MGDPSEGLPSRLACIRIADVFVHPLEAPTIRSTLVHFVEARRPRQILTVNLDFVQLARRSAEFRQVVNSAALAVLDGKPLVWLARNLGIACDRVTGPDLIAMFCGLSAEHGYRMFLLGGAPAVALEAKEQLERSYPGVRVCGAFSPPFADYPFPRELDEQISRRIKEARPDILLVAFGCPKQDFWIHDHLEELAVPVAVGVGASLDFIAGRVHRAPECLQQWGLEWLYRLCLEPRRLWRRYLKDDAPFMLKLLVLHALARLRLVERPILEQIARG